MLLLFTIVGGGECIDPEDCNNNGICKPESEGKGVCCCAVGFAGTNCDGEFPFMSYLSILASFCRNMA